MKNKKSNIFNKNQKNNKQIVYKYDPFIKVYRENFNNKYLTRNNFHNIKIQDAAMVMLENDKNEILFLNEYRRGLKKMSLGLPGGHIEKNEKPISTIKRELLEETGHYATSWKLLLKYTMHGTYELGKDYFFTAKLVEKNTKNKSENIQKKWLNKKKMLYMLNNKKFETAGIIAAVSYYLLFKK